jgi:hypothetical protein
VTERFVIVAGRDGRVDWLSRDEGVVVFQREVNAEVLSDLLLIEPNESLTLPDDLVIVSTVENNRLLIAFTLNDGAQRWVYAR